MHSHAEKEHTPQLVQLDSLTIDLKAYCIRSTDGTVTPLTPQERVLLRALIDAGGSVVSKQELGRLAWGWEHAYPASAIWTCVSSLRRKLGDNWQHPRFILTVRPIGYRINFPAPTAPKDAPEARRNTP